VQQADNGAGNDGLDDKGRIAHAVGEVVGDNIGKLSTSGARFYITVYDGEMGNKRP